MFFDLPQIAVLHVANVDVKKLTVLPVSYCSICVDNVIPSVAVFFFIVNAQQFFSNIESFSVAYDCSSKCLDCHELV